jgi:hypothetical protein
MMSCPDLGTLRASLDGAAGAPPAPDEHLRTCPACADTLAELQRNAELAAPAIALTAPADQLTPAQVEAALAALEQRRSRLAATRAAGAVHSPPAASVSPAAPVSPADPVPLARRRRLANLGMRARVAAAALVAALALTGVVATPGGRAAASSFLAQFRSQRFQVLSVDPTQANQVEGVLSGLAETGVFTGPALQDRGVGEPRVVADRAEAARLAGFAVPVVDPAALPKGVDRTPRHLLVSPARELRLTFDRDKALAYLRAHGRPDARLPERYDGTRLVVQVPAAIVQEFAGRDGGPALLVGKAGTLAMTTEGGASLEELREVVLGLPGLPAELVAQLRGIGDWRNTLPLPVPDQVRSSPTTVNGAEALSFADESGRLHALVWQRDGHIWGVAGVVGRDEARDVANRLG